jgi:hypothetical protein
MQHFRWAIIYWLPRPCTRVMAQKGFWFSSWARISRFINFTGRKEHSASAQSRLCFPFMVAASCLSPFCSTLSCNFACAVFWKRRMLCSHDPTITALPGAPWSRAIWDLNRLASSGPHLIASPVANKTGSAVASLLHAIPCSQVVHVGAQIACQKGMRR